MTVHTQCVIGIWEYEFSISLALFNFVDTTEYVGTTACWKNHTSFVQFAAAIYLLTINFWMCCWSCLLIGEQITGKITSVTMSPNKNKKAARFFARLIGENIIMSFIALSNYLLSQEL